MGNTSPRRRYKRANGLGSVYPINNGSRYRASIHDIHGQRRTKTCTFKKDAELWLAQQLAYRERGTTTYSVQPQMQMSEMLEGWLANKVAIEDSTRTNYAGAIKTRINPYIGKIKVEKVTARSIEDLLRQLTVKDYGFGSIMLTYNILNMAFGDAERLGDIHSNPMKKVRRPKGRSKSISPIPEKDLLRIYQGVSHDPYLQAWIEVACVLGPRPGEVFALRWSDIDFDNRRIEIKQTIKEDGSIGETKTHSVYRKPLTENQVDILLKHRDAQLCATEKWSSDKDFVFPNNVGGPMEMRNVRRRWSALLDSLGLPHYELRQLRKNALTSFAEFAGPGVLKAFAGHGTAQTTLTYYVHPPEEQVREALTRVEEQRSARNRVTNLADYQERKSS